MGDAGWMPSELKEPYDAAPPRAVTPPSLLASQYGEKSPQLDELVAMAGGGPVATSARLGGTATTPAAPSNAVTIRIRNGQIPERRITRAS
jgi:hypothetical protein